MHDRLITFRTHSFDPTKGVSEVMRRKKREVKSKFDYNTLNVCNTLVYVDKYAGLSSHTIWQWGHPPGSSSKQILLHWTCPAKPPAVVEQMA